MKERETWDWCGRANMPFSRGEMQPTSFVLPQHVPQPINNTVYNGRHIGAAGMLRNLGVLSVSVPPS